MALACRSGVEAGDGVKFAGATGFSICAMVVPGPELGISPINVRTTPRAEGILSFSSCPDLIRAPPQPPESAAITGSSPGSSPAMTARGIAFRRKQFFAGSLL
jgi:hypothetical protein